MPTRFFLIVKDVKWLSLLYTSGLWFSDCVCKQTYNESQQVPLITYVLYFVPQTHDQ